MRYIMYTLYVIYAIPMPASDVPYQLYRIYQAVEQITSALPQTIHSEFQMLHNDPNFISLRNEETQNDIEQYLSPFDKFASGITSETTRKNKVLQARIQMSRYVKKHPLRCFFECNTKKCPLSRRNNPQFRDKFDQHVSERIVNTPNTPVHYASIGSGGLLQDLRILALALSKNPHLYIHIHLIDPAFKVFKPQTQTLYNEAQQFDTSTTPIKPNSLFNRAKVQEMYAENLEHNAPPEVSESKEPKYQYNYMQDPTPEPHYLLYILRNEYPNAKIIGHIYTELQHYQQFIQGIIKGPTLYQTQAPDIVAVSDIEHPRTFIDLADTTMRIFKNNLGARMVNLLSFPGNTPSPQDKVTFSEFSYTQFPDSQPYLYKDALSYIVPPSIGTSNLADDTIYATIRTLQ